MNIFYRPKYKSEAGQFIDLLKSKDPALEAKQRQGRGLLWDKDVNRSDWREYRAAQVEQQCYVYQTEAKE